MAIPMEWRVEVWQHSQHNGAGRRPGNEGHKANQQEHEGPAPCAPSLLYYCVEQQGQLFVDNSMTKKLVLEGA